MDIKWINLYNDYLAIVSDKTVPVRHKSGTLTLNCSSYQLAIAWKFYSLNQNHLFIRVSELAFSLPTKIVPLLYISRYGPFAPIGKPIPLHSYRSFKKTNTQKRADRIEQIASQLALPSSAIGKVELPVVAENVIPFPVRSFVDPDPFEELTFKNAIEAKKAISYYLVKPLAKLTPEQMATVESILEKTLKKEEVMTQIKDYFNQFS